MNIERRNSKIPNFYDLGYGNISIDQISLNTCMSCYFEKDIDDIISFMSVKFSNSYKIPFIPTRFFKNFIDGQSNLYINKFERVIGGRDVSLIDFDEFNYSMEWVEKYFHILRQSILYIKSPTEFIPIDASNYRELDKNDYLIMSEDSYYRVNSTGVYQRLYVENIDDNYNFEDVLLYSINGVCPIIKLCEFGVSEPQINTLVSLEYNTIADISWGVYNATPKLLTQALMKSDETLDKSNDVAGGFGRTSKMLKVGSGEDITTIDMGDLRNLIDIQSVYDSIIVQQAIRRGIDSYSVSLNPLATVSSGESKKVELSYVNQYRKKYFRMFNKFEKQVFDTISKLFNLNLEFKKIEFYDIEYGFITTVENKGETTTSNEIVKTEAVEPEVKIDDVKTEVDKDIIE